MNSFTKIKKTYMFIKFTSDIGFPVLKYKIITCKCFYKHMMHTVISNHYVYFTKVKCNLQFSEEFLHYAFDLLPFIFRNNSLYTYYIVNIQKKNNTIRSININRNNSNACSTQNPRLGTKTVQFTVIVLLKLR